MSTHSLPLEIERLLERVVEQPNGLVLLLHGELESLAMLLQVHPDLIEEARSWLHPPERRAVFNDAVVRLRLAHRHRRAASGHPHDEHHVTPEELIHAAEHSSFGVEFLQRAPVETVAIVFGAHVFTVEKARDLLSGSSANP